MTLAKELSRRKYNFILFFLFFGFLSSILVAQPGESCPHGMWVFYMENDVFAGTDRSFTGAFKLGWLSEIKKFRKHWLWKRVPFRDKAEYRHFVSFSAGLNGYNPPDINRSELMEDDRPYAGYVYLELGFQTIGVHHKENLEVNLGIVGPHSYVEEVQKIFHSVNFINGYYPQGWKHQLKDELTIGLIYENKWKLFKYSGEDGWGFDVIPHLGGGIGNVYTYLSTGVQVRLGWNLPHDFGVPLLRPGGDHSLGYRKKGKTGIHLFVATDGKAVIRNIFLDGNTFQESHRVEKNLFTADFQAGIFFRIKKRFNICFQYVFWSKKFKTEPFPHVFGILSLSYTY